MTMRRYGGPGMHGIGGLPLIREGGVLGSPPLDFDFDVFTAGMAKRGGTGVFAAAPIVQGKWDGSGTPDVLSLSRGTQFGNPTKYTYSNLDPYQGSIVFWITPEWDGNDGLIHVIYRNAGVISIYKSATNSLNVRVGGQDLTVNIAAWTAATTYHAVLGNQTLATNQNLSHALIQCTA